MGSKPARQELAEDQGIPGGRVPIGSRKKVLNDFLTHEGLFQRDLPFRSWEDGDSTGMTEREKFKDSCMALSYARFQDRAFLKTLGNAFADTILERRIRILPK